MMLPDDLDLVYGKINFDTPCFDMEIKVDQKLVKAPPPPSNFIASRPKAALLFWCFGGFRCGVPLFLVMLVIY